MKRKLSNVTALPAETPQSERDIEVARRVFADEIDALQNLRVTIDDNFHRAVETIFRCKGRLIVSGVGKSGIIGKKIAATFTSTGTPSFYIHPVEAAHGDLGLVTRDDTVLFISNSGMSDEFRMIQSPLRKLGVAIVAITGNRNSYLAKQADIVLHYHIDHEACALDLAPTTSTTAVLVLGDALACALMKRRDFKAEDFARNHPSGILGRRLTLKVSGLMRTGDALPLVTVDTSLRDALVTMAAGAAGCVGVVDGDGKLRGIITDGDLKRIFVSVDDALGARSGDVMTNNPRTIDGEILAANALKQMEMNPSGPLTMYFIVDAAGRPMGLLHIHDLLRAGLGVES